MQQPSVNPTAFIGEYRDHVGNTTHELLFTKALLKEALSQIVELQAENTRLRESAPTAD